MTAPTTTVTVDAGQALALFGLLIRGVSDLSPVLGGPINKSVDTLFLRQFASEGEYGNGIRWRSLSPITLKLRARPGHGRGGILRDTNRLWASLTKGGLGPDAVLRVTPTGLFRGTTVPYAQFHQTGFESKTFIVLDKNGNPVPLRRRRPKRIPARPIVPETVPSELLRTWERTVATFIEGGREPSAA